MCSIPNRNPDGPSRLEDAQDLTQAFFVRLLAREQVRLADPARGLFRTFLLKALQNFLTDDWRQAHRVKRGGGVATIPLDAQAAAARYAGEAMDALTPERPMKDAGR